MDFYVHLQSGDSRAYFPGNKASHFTTKLLETLHLKVCSDMCGETIVGKKRLPLLRIINAKKKNSLSFNPVYYMPVRVQEMDKISIEINTADTGEEMEFPTSGTTSCTLHFEHPHSDKYQPSTRSQLIPSRTMAERTSEKLMDAVADGAWQVLQHYVCRGYKRHSHQAQCSSTLSCAPFERKYR